MRIAIIELSCCTSDAVFRRKLFSNLLQGQYLYVSVYYICMHTNSTLDFLVKNGNTARSFRRHADNPTTHEQLMSSRSWSSLGGTLASDMWDTISRSGRMLRHRSHAAHNAPRNRITCKGCERWVGWVRSCARQSIFLRPVFFNWSKWLGVSQHETRAPPNDAKWAVGN